MFFLAILLAAQIQTTPPKILHLFDKQDACELAALKVNAMAELNTDEAKSSGATAVCLMVIEPGY